MIRVECVLSDIARGDSQNGDSGRGGNVALQPVEVPINGLRFPAGIGEYRVIDLGEDALGGQGERGTGLNSST